VVDKKLVLSKEQVNGDLGYAWLKTNYAGSGALKLREWRANEVLVLERNDQFYGDKSKLARVIYRFTSRRRPRSACCWKRVMWTWRATCHRRI
jgi:ABC-type transport system substrate-binding protein